MKRHCIDCIHLIPKRSVIPKTNVVSDYHVCAAKHRLTLVVRRSMTNVRYRRYDGKQCDDWKER